MNDKLILDEQFSKYKDKNKVSELREIVLTIANNYQHLNALYNQNEDYSIVADTLFVSYGISVIGKRLPIKTVKDCFKLATKEVKKRYIVEREEETELNMLCNSLDFRNLERVML